MKRLFSVNGSYYDNKADAKQERDSLSEPRPTIRLGADHWRYGLKGNPRTHSHNAHSGGHGNGFPRKARRFN